MVQLTSSSVINQGISLGKSYDEISKALAQSNTWSAEGQTELDFRFDKESEEDKLKSAMDVSVAQEKIKDVRALAEDEAGLEQAVGTIGLGRMGIRSMLTGDKQDFIAGVQQAVSQETLDTLIELKSRGGTLGALSEKELAMLEGSASKIGTWAIRDKEGKVTGYKASEEDFKAELNKIAEVTDRVMKMKTEAGEELPDRGEVMNKMNSLYQFSKDNPDDPRSKKFMADWEGDKFDLSTGQLKQEFKELSPFEQKEKEQVGAKVAGADVISKVPEGVLEAGAEEVEEGLISRVFKGESGLIQNLTQDFGDLAGDIGETGREIAENFNTAKESSVRAFDALKAGDKETFDLSMESAKASTQLMSLEGAVGVAGSLGKFVGDLAGTGLEAMDDATKNVVSKTMESAFDTVLEEIGETESGSRGLEAIQGTAEDWKAFAEENPEIARDISNVFGIIEGASTLIGGVAVAKGVKKAGVAGVEKVGEMAIKETAEEAVAGVKKVAGEAVGKVEEGASGLAKFGTAQATGLQKETVEQILKSPEKFTKKELAEADRMSVVNKVKESLDADIEDLAETGKKYNTIRESGETVKIPEDTINKVLGKHGIKIEDGKVVTSAESVPLGQGDITAIEGFISQYGDETLSANAFLNARKALSNMSKFDATKTDASKNIAKEMRKAYDTIGKKEITGLKELDAEFAPQIKTINQFRKDFLNADGTLKDGAIGKISNLTGKNKNMILDRVKKLVPTIEEDINIIKAIEDIESISGQKVGAYMRGATGGFVLSGGNPIATIITSIATSPQVAIPMIRGFSKAKGMSKKATESIINKVKSGEKLNKKESTFIKNAVESEVEKISGLEKVAGVAVTGKALKDVTEAERTE